jgi:hypothetical protein
MEGRKQAASKVTVRGQLCMVPHAALRRSDWVLVVLSTLGWRRVQCFASRPVVTTDAGNVLPMSPWNHVCIDGVYGFQRC